MVKHFTLALLLFLSFFNFNTFAQLTEKAVVWKEKKLESENLSQEEIKSSIVKYDFGPLWTNTKNEQVLGYIGTNYQRIRIKIISAKKRANEPDTYDVYGKSMVKTNICQFTGTIRITHARELSVMHLGLDDEFKDAGIKKQGFVICEYTFLEDSLQTSSGKFQGILSTDWYIDKDNELKYDNLSVYSDNYRNNQFVGMWKPYKKTTFKVCNWGDYRIPYSEELDQGAGEFSPTDKYLPNGWQSYKDAFSDEKIKQTEQREWWK